MRNVKIEAKSFTYTKQDDERLVFMIFGAGGTADSDIAEYGTARYLGRTYGNTSAGTRSYGYLLDVSSLVNGESIIIKFSSSSGSGNGGYMTL